MGNLSTAQLPRNPYLIPTTVLSFLPTYAWTLSGGKAGSDRADTLVSRARAVMIKLLIFVEHPPWQLTPPSLPPCRLGAEGVLVCETQPPGSHTASNWGLDTCMDPNSAPI